jgi:hypothetical protein
MRFEINQTNSGAVSRNNIDPTILLHYLFVWASILRRRQHYKVWTKFAAWSVFIYNPNRLRDNGFPIDEIIALLIPDGNQ